MSERTRGFELPFSSPIREGSGAEIPLPALLMFFLFPIFSNDGRQTFGDKINLSNSPDTQSRTAEILAIGNTIFVTWWELNENVHPHTNESVMTVSTDAGQTFGPVINLGTNGTISTTTNGGNSTTAATTS